MVKKILIGIFLLFCLIFIQSCQQKIVPNFKVDGIMMQRLNIAGIKKFDNIPGQYYLIAIKLKDANQRKQFCVIKDYLGGITDMIDTIYVTDKNFKKISNSVIGVDKISNIPYEFLNIEYHNWAPNWPDKILNCKHVKNLDTIPDIINSLDLNIDDYSYSQNDSIHYFTAIFYINDSMKIPKTIYLKTKGRNFMSKVNNTPINASLKGIILKDSGE